MKHKRNSSNRTPRHRAQVTVIKQNVWYNQRKILPRPQRREFP